MEVKTFEVRDAGSFIPCIAIRLNPATEKDRYLIGRAGYGQHAKDQGEFIIFGRLRADSVFQYDALSWNDRTMKKAHEYVAENFSTMINGAVLESGAVIDVEFLLGITSEPKKSESES